MKSPISKVSVLKIFAVGDSDFGNYECRISFGYEIQTLYFDVIDEKIGSGLDDSVIESTSSTKSTTTSTSTSTTTSTETTTELTTESSTQSITKLLPISNARVSIKIDPDFSSNFIGETIYTNCFVIGFKKDDKPLNFHQDDFDFKWLKVKSGKSVSNDAKLRIDIKSRDDDDFYECTAKHKQYNVTSKQRPFQLFVHKLQIKANGADVDDGNKIIEISENENLELLCLINDKEAKNVVWTRFDGIYQSNTVIDGNKLIITNARTENSGKYACHSRTMVETQNQFEITVKSDSSETDKPLIKIELINNVDSTNYQQAEHYRFLCKPEKGYNVKVSWLLPVSDSTFSHVTVYAEDDGEVLDIEVLTDNDQGNYECHGFNSNGQDRVGVDVTIDECISFSN